MRTQTRYGILKNIVRFSVVAGIVAILGGFGSLALAGPPSGNVKVTPLGSHEGELCFLDRALVFEDPNGTRILYDTGYTVRGPGDPRLGTIDAVLLSHVHHDHLGLSHQPSADFGICGPFFVPGAPSHLETFNQFTTPISNTTRIAVAKGAKIVVGGEMDAFFVNQVIDAGGNAADVWLARFGGERVVGGVKITTVPAVHTNGLIPAFLTDTEHAAALAADGLTAYVGPPTGYVLQFTNGLVVYLSGDTGITAEQKLVVREYYGAKLAVINIGGIFTNGPIEAAHVINDLVKPRSVIASHVNEVATEDGKLKAGTKTAQFMSLVHNGISVHLALSEATMEFNKNGKCVAGC